MPNANSQQQVPLALWFGEFAEGDNTITLPVGYGFMLTQALVANGSSDTVEFYIQYGGLAFIVGTLAPVTEGPATSSWSLPGEVYFDNTDNVLTLYAGSTPVYGVLGGYLIAPSTGQLL